MNHLHVCHVDLSTMKAICIFILICLFYYKTAIGCTSEIKNFFSTEEEVEEEYVEPDWDRFAQLVICSIFTKYKATLT